MKRFEDTSLPMPTRNQSPGDYNNMLRERRDFDLSSRMGYLQGYVEALVWRIERLEEVNSDLRERLARLEVQMER